MASVFRKRDRRTGKKLPAWRFKFKGADGRWHYGVGWPDKQKTVNHAADVEADARAIRTGEKDAPKSTAAKRNTPIGTVTGEYLAWGEVQGGLGGRPWDDQNAKLKRINLEYWKTELGLTLLSDIDLPRVEKVVQALLAAGKAPKTVSLRVESLRSFCLWAIRRGYLAGNPLAGIARLDTRPREPHRALTDAEIAALLGTAPPDRRLWYETALATGFRLSELRDLRVKDLDVFAPSIFLAADFSKDRHDHRQPITRQLADRLKAKAGDRPGDAPLLEIPKSGAHKDNRYDPGGLLAKDYRAAGVTILTPEGRATWHSLRKSFVTNVVRSGCDLKTAMTLARHSTAQLTMETYAAADPALLRQAAEAAECRVRTAVSRAACCSRGARKAAGAEGSNVSADAEGRSGINREWAILDSNQ